MLNANDFVRLEFVPFAEQKYPQLCELCTSMTSSCDYTDAQDLNGQLLSRHAHALQCLSEKGDLAYVALDEAKQYFASVCLSAFSDFYFYSVFSVGHFGLIRCHFARIPVANHIGGQIRLHVSERDNTDDQSE